MICADYSSFLVLKLGAASFAAFFMYSFNKAVFVRRNCQPTDAGNRSRSDKNEMMCAQ